MMDEYFQYFLEKMGQPIDRRYVPPSSIERYRGKLPNQLLSYWEEHGWCAYADGLFWTVNPQEFEPALEAWIGDTPFMEEDAYHVIARSAFGDLFLFGGEYGQKLHIVAPDSKVIPSKKKNLDLDLSIRSFFASMSPEVCEFSDVDGKGLFARAANKLGRLQHDEMYGFVPALAAGGRATLDHLQRVKAVEHLVILAQCAPLDVIAPPLS
jgi:hypothetical protein